MDDPISVQIRETAQYAGVSYHAIAEVAAVIEELTDDKERRARLRREFKQAHGLTAQVWARVPARFDGMQIPHGEHAGMMVRDYKTMSEKEIRAASYLCQLPMTNFLDLYDAVSDNLGDHGGVLNQVNETLEAIRHEREDASRGVHNTLAHQVVQVLNNVYGHVSDTAKLAMIAALPAIVRETKRDEKRMET